MSTGRRLRCAARRDSAWLLETLRNQPGGLTRRSGTKNRQGSLFMGCWTAKVSSKKTELKNFYGNKMIFSERLKIEMAELSEINNRNVNIPLVLE